MVSDMETSRSSADRDPLRVAAELSMSFLERVGEPPVFPNVSIGDLRRGLDVPLPDAATDPTVVLEQLAAAAEPGLVKSQGGRYFGFVTGGALPAAIGADWLTSAWDQNSFSYISSPAASVIEEVAARWLLEVLDLPSGSATAFVTGCQMAHVTALAAARHRVLGDAGWDVSSRGLYGAPEVSIVAGELRHSTVDRALRLLGMGTDSLRLVDCDDAGRMISDHLAEVMDDLTSPIIIVAQAGEVNTGSFDPIDEIAQLGHEAGAWLHIDGAFGMWARAEPTLAHLARGTERADSWAFDAHKWLNVPYDSGVAMVAHPTALQAAMAYTGAYLMPSRDHRDAMDWTPDASRRARGIPIYAALRSLGRRGVGELVGRSCRLARTLANGLTDLGLELLNDVVLNQVLVRASSDAATEELLAEIQAGGEAWMGGTTWDDRRAIRVSVSGWASTEEDVSRTVAAFDSALSALNT